MSVSMLASKSVTAQTIQTMGGPIRQDELQVGGDPEDIAVNTDSGTVSVIDGNTDTVKKTIQVGKMPRFVLVDGLTIYIANYESFSVSVTCRQDDRSAILISGSYLSDWVIDVMRVQR